MGRGPDVAGGDEAAHPGRRDSHGFGFPRLARGGGGAEQADAGDVEAEPGAHALEQGHVAFPPTPEVEVVAHHHGPGVEATDEHFGHEILGRFGRPRGRRSAAPG